MKADRLLSRRSTVYFPPIGMRLMKKYVGLELKKLPRFLSTLPNQAVKSKETLTAKPPVVTGLISKREAVDMEDKTAVETKERTQSKYENTYHSTENSQHNIQNLSTCLPKISVTDYTSSGADNDFNNTTIISPGGETEEDEFVGDEVFTEIDQFKLCTPNRRSSRSTFRSRNSVRFLSQPSFLEEHNMQVIAMPKTRKAISKSTTDVDTTALTAIEELYVESNNVQINPGDTNKNTLPMLLTERKINFSLDYGDGKLHDILKIPKVKDCSRPWCNPFCKTCQMRTTSRPCFVLVPYEGNEPPRKSFIDTRRPSMFPVYKANKKDNAKNINVIEGKEALDDKQETGRDNKTKAVRHVEEVESSSDINNTPRSITEEITEGSNVANESVSSENIEEVTDETVNKAVSERPTKTIKPPKKKGYSRRRMDELCQPRGGPPAEVRFSKTSLRRKQEQLVESNGMKEITEREQQNLSFIQGKISVFLAMLNQKELAMKPAKMVDIPIREEIDSDKIIHEARKRNKIKQKK